jgi:hypothetical protein
VLVLGQRASGLPKRWWHTSREHPQAEHQRRPRLQVRTGRLCARPGAIVEDVGSKMAAGPAPEPDDRDGTKVKEDSTNVQIIPQHP